MDWLVLRELSDQSRVTGLLADCYHNQQIRSPMIMTVLNILIGASLILRLVVLGPVSDDLWRSVSKQE